ncbi:uncharacterized protein BDW70DRAFT_7572 [Aspergillus foveolatus]|uniref:uncharacterized protein n=1 Tax=Aspergillus foveolatus TaxID=210207 RepID=UPI003CCE3314
MQRRFEGQWAEFRLATRFPAPQGCRQPRCVPRAPILGVEISQAGPDAPSAKAPALLLALRRTHNRYRRITGGNGSVLAAGSLRDAFAKTLRPHLAFSSRMRHSLRCSNSPRYRQPQNTKPWRCSDPGSIVESVLSPLNTFVAVVIADLDLNRVPSPSFPDISLHCRI